MTADLAFEEVREPGAVRPLLESGGADRPAVLIPLSDDAEPEALRTGLLPEGAAFAGIARPMLGDEVEAILVPARL